MAPSTRLHRRVRPLPVLLVVAALAGCAVLRPLQPSPAPTDLEGILDAHARAHGLSREGQMPGALHTRADVEAMGFVGTLETWSEPPLSTWARMDLGAIALETGFDGSTGWIRDRNGAVRATSGHELAGMLLDALLTTGAYVLRRPPVALTWSLLEGPVEPGTVELALQLAQPGVSPMILVLSTRNWRLLRTQWDNGQSVDVTQYRDYRTRGGRLMAHRVQMTYGPTSTLLAAVNSVERTAPRGLRAYAHPGVLPQADITFPPQRRSTTLPMEPGFEHVLVPARVNGVHTGLFLLDTGAGSNVLHAARLPELGLTAVGAAETNAATGTAVGQFVAIDSLQLGELVLHRQSWVTLDLSALEEHFGPRLLGVLGYDLLHGVVLEVDYAERVVRFHERSSYLPPAGATQLPVRMQQNVPAVQAEVEGILAWLQLDTGSDNTLDLASPFVQAHRLLEGRDRLEPVLARGVSGAAPALRGTVRSVALAGITVADVPCTFNSVETGVFGADIVAGVIGAGLLSRFLCVFDYAGSSVWLAPRAGLP